MFYRKLKERFFIPIIPPGTHAREWITPASVTYIIDQLTENRDNHADIVKGLDFYILPVVNPDGYEYSHLKDRLWRKNRAPNGFCVGTDLNRNWGYKWGGAGSSNVPCKEIFAGSRAFSEPETQAISNFVLAHKDKIKVHVNLKYDLNADKDIKTNLDWDDLNVS